MTIGAGPSHKAGRPSSSSPWNSSFAIMSLPLQGFLRFSSAHPSVAFTIPSDLVSLRYGQLISILRLCPPHASLSGPDLPVANRNWILDMDSAVRLWHGVFESDEDLQLFLPFLALDLVSSDHHVLEWWELRSTVYPVGYTPRIFPARDVLPPVLPRSPLASSTTSSRGRPLSARRSSARRGVSRTSGSQASAPPSPFSSWAEPLLPSHFDSSGIQVYSDEARRSIQEEYRQQRQQPGYRCFNCRVYNHPCVALLDDQPRCVYCQSINRACLPGPPITPVGLVPSWSSSRSPAPPSSVSVASGALRTSPDVVALLSSFNLTLSDFHDFVQQRGSGSASG